MTTDLSAAQSTASALLVVGSGPAGLAAAKAYREAGGSGPVRMVSVDTRPPYDRPPLTKEFLRGEQDAGDLALEDAAFYAEHDIELLLDVEVLGLAAADRSLLVADGGRLTYEQLVVATGSRPAAPPIDGVDHDEVLMVRSLADGMRLRDRAAQAKTAVVVGSGFIGCEAAVSLARLGLDVRVVTVESKPQVSRLGDAVADRLLAWLAEDGVVVTGDAQVGRIEAGRTVVLGSGERLSADLVLVAAGAKPRTELLAETGLTLERGRVPVDQHMRTDLPGVFAAGDIAFAHNTAAGRRLAVEHWDDADAMGTVAGTAAAGGAANWDSVPSFFTGIGDRWLMYASFGDPFDEVRFVEHDDGAFTVWYGAGGVTVGVLTHDRDADLEQGKDFVRRGLPLPQP